MMVYVGFDKELIMEFDKTESTYIISGGAGNSEQILEIITETNCGAVAVGSAFHYNIINVKGLKSLASNNIDIRR